MAFLPVIIVFLLYFSGIPIAYALFASSLFYFGVLNTGSPTDLILQKFITSTQSFPLLAIPFFVMAGSIMNYAGISTKLMSFADRSSSGRACPGQRTPQYADGRRVRFGQRRRGHAV